LKGGKDVGSEHALIFRIASGVERMDLVFVGGPTGCPETACRDPRVVRSIAVAFAGVVEIGNPWDWLWQSSGEMK